MAVDLLGYPPQSLLILSQPWVEGRGDSKNPNFPDFRENIAIRYLTGIRSDRRSQGIRQSE